MERHQRVAGAARTVHRARRRYRGRVEIVALEAPPPVLRDRNRRRESPVPDAVVDRLVRRWETPDPTEAHRVDWLTGG